MSCILEVYRSDSYDTKEFENQISILLNHGFTPEENAKCLKIKRNYGIRAANSSKEVDCTTPFGDLACTMHAIHKLFVWLAR